MAKSLSTLRDNINMFTGDASNVVWSQAQKSLAINLAIQSAWPELKKLTRTQITLTEGSYAYVVTAMTRAPWGPAQVWIATTATTQPVYRELRRSVLCRADGASYSLEFDSDLVDNRDGYKVEVHPVALRKMFVVDEEAKIPVRPFVHGSPYKLLGLFETDMHLIGPAEYDEDPNRIVTPMYLLGGDRIGRDVLSRIIYGTRISMTIGLVGVALSFFIGILLGGLSGFYSGWVDNIIQRGIELLRSMPTTPLWMGLAAALPSSWTPIQVFFGITVLLSLIGWTGLARVVRGRFLALRTEDFVMSARLDGNSTLRIIRVHMIPSFASHIIASLTLAIPGMILAETALSFLGLGLRPPIVSWGVLLKEAQNIRSVATAPWLLLPGGAVIIAVLALNFLGDGLRDAADPYGR